MLLCTSVAAGFLFEDKAIFSEKSFVCELIRFRSRIGAIRPRLGLVLYHQRIKRERSLDEIVFVGVSENRIRFIHLSAVCTKRTDYVRLELVLEYWLQLTLSGR